MRLWTIQDMEAYLKLQADGVLHSVGMFNKDSAWEEFREPFRWMAEMMEARGIKRPDGAEYPLWAWYQYDGKRKKRNVRDSGLGNPGEKLVQLTIDIPFCKVLLSDFEAWTAVYYKSYLAQSEKEAEEWEKKACTLYALTGDYQAAVRKSWEKIFDVFGEKEGSRRLPPPKQRTVQACFWELKSEQVKSVQFFTARGEK